jgi:hypothetical protein
MKMTLRTAVLVASTFASAAVLSLAATGQAEARRIYVGPRFAAHAVYHRDAGLPWYAVRAYYWGGPWSGPYYSWNGWADYAKVNGIACVPGTIVKGGDGIWYNCQ